MGTDQMSHSVCSPESRGLWKITLRPSGLNRGGIHHHQNAGDEKSVSCVLWPVARSSTTSAPRSVAYTASRCWNTTLVPSGDHCGHQKWVLSGASIVMALL